MSIYWTATSEDGDCYMFETMDEAQMMITSATITARLNNWAPTSWTLARIEPTTIDEAMKHFAITQDVKARNPS